MSVNIKLVKKEEVARDTMAFYFEKPVGFKFKAGQFGDFTLINPSETDEEGNRRAFSFANAPEEQNLRITTRMRDTAFKRVLKNLPIGSELQFDGPFGSFTLHSNVTIPAVFLIGGIGITPVISIIEYATLEKLDHKIFLFYANRTKEDSAYLEELEDYSKKNPNFTFVPVMTREEDWSGEKGHVTSGMISKYIADLKQPIYYLSGPAGMVKAMRSILEEAQVNEDNIKTEEFPGY